MSAERRDIAHWLFVACGVWLIGLGAYFIFVRPALLPEDLRYLGTNLAVLTSVAPRITDWLKLVFTVMGGFMAGAGVLVAYFALGVLPRRPRHAGPALLLAGLLSVGLMSAANFLLESDFRWLLVVPSAAWAVATALHGLRGRNQG